MELPELTEEQKEWIEELEEMWPQWVNRVQKAMYLVRGTEELLRIKGLRLEKAKKRIKELEKELLQLKNSKND